MPWEALILDSFTDVNGTLLINHTSELGGAWGSGSGSILSDKAAECEAVHSKEATSGDAYAQAVFSWIAAYGNGRLDIGWISNVYWPDRLEIQPFDGNRVILNDVVLTGVIPTNGALWRIETVGSAVNAYKDGVLVGTGLKRAGGTKFQIAAFSYNQYKFFIDDYEAGEWVIPPPPSVYVDHLMLMELH